MANVGDTYTPPAGAGQGNIDQMTREVISGFKGLPQMKQNLGETLLSQDPMTGPLAEDRGKLVQQLFDYDKNLNTKYSDPSSPYYVEDPSVRTAQAGEAKNALWGSLANTNALLAARRQVLGNQVDQGVEAYKYGLDAREKELQYALERQKLGTSGAGQKQQQIMALAAELQTAQADPTLLDRVMKKYTVMGLSPEEVMQTYTIQKGPTGMSSLEISQKYGTKYDDNMSIAERYSTEAKQGSNALASLFQASGYNPQTGNFSMAKEGSFLGMPGNVGGIVNKLAAWGGVNKQAEGFQAARNLAKPLVLAALAKSAVGGINSPTLQKEADTYLPDMTDSSSEMASKFARLQELLTQREQMFGNTASTPVNSGMAVNPNSIMGPTAQPTGSIFVRGK